MARANGFRRVPFGPRVRIGRADVRQDRELAINDPQGGTQRFREIRIETVRFAADGFESLPFRTTTIVRFDSRGTAQYRKGEPS